MLRVVCVREDLFNGFGSEESADQRMSSGRENGEAHCRINKPLFHLGASIAGQFHSSRMDRVLRFTVRRAHRPARSVARAARRNASNNRR